MILIVLIIAAYMAILFYQSNRVGQLVSNIYEAGTYEARYW